ncbi:hypothetical protein AB0K60_11515 [Thermopolyspora sp. NPDC052614]|uniref:hypothetical protein n=1 Tax=Thermopolyspora sp. NPDC052614 TaxID=3155682 RepID=UPI003436F97C
MSDRSMSSEADAWACPHGRNARSGCVTCYEDSLDPDPASPMWQVAVWFTATRAIPVRTLKEVRRHGRQFTLAQPSTPLVYLLTGHAPAHDAAQAIAGVVGFLLRDQQVAGTFTVTDARAVPLPPALASPDR